MIVSLRDFVRVTSGIVALGVLSLFGALPASAGGPALYSVSLDTTALANGIYGSAPFMMDFQFIDGGGTSGEPNNLATISGFMYGGGSGPTTLVNLADGSPPSTGETILNFTPGTSLNFNLSLTTNEDTGSGALSDTLSFAILDSNGDEIPTTALGEEFFDIAEPSVPGNTTPTVTTFSASNGRGGTFQPTITTGGANGAPEPGTPLYFTAASTVAFAVRRLAKRRRPARVSSDSAGA